MNLLKKEVLVKFIKLLTWIDGPPYWNDKKEDFEYKDPNKIVALKHLNNSANITFEELKEVGILFYAIIFINMKKLIFIL